MSVSLKNLDFKVSGSWECARDLLAVLPVLFSSLLLYLCLLCSPLTLLEAGKTGWSWMVLSQFPGSG